MPDPTDNQVAPPPKGTPTPDTAGDTAASGQRLLQSANGDKTATPPAGADQPQTQSQASEGDAHARLLDDYLRSSGDARLNRPGQPSDSAVGAKPTPENITKGFAELEQNLSKIGMDSDRAKEVSREFEKLREQGKLPQDLSGIKSCLDRLNRDGKNDTLTRDAADTVLRLVSASLEGKVTLITPATGAAVAGREQYNRENPDYVKAKEYQEGDTNCRACTGSIIMNEKLSDRAMLLEYTKVLDKVEEGKAKILFVPIEDGIPKMTSDAFELNHGATHTGTAGQVFTPRQLEEFQKKNKSVPTYIADGLKQAGFTEANLPGGETKTSFDAAKAMKTPGWYVLEHPTTGGSVSGHVTAAYVDADGKVHRHDSQIPDNHTREWQISNVYQVEIGKVSSEEKMNRTNVHTGQTEASTRVSNPDGTVRDFGFNKKTGLLQSLTDVDGRSYFKSPEGKWQTEKQGITVDAPFKDVEYLGTAGGTKFTFNDHTITERPNGTADISVPNSVLMHEGKPIKLNGVDAKASDLISKIERQADGSFEITFKDKSTAKVKPEKENPSSTDNRSIQQVEGQLKRLDRPGTAGGDSLNQAAVGRITEITATGADFDTAVLKLHKPGADVDRMSQISDAMRKVGIPTDLQSINRIDNILTEMKLTVNDVDKAKPVLEKGQALLSKSQSDKTPLTERQAFEIAILQATENPDKPGKKYTEASARAVVKRADEVRGEVRATEAPLSTALELLRVRDQYAGAVLDSFTTPSDIAITTKSKGNDIRVAYATLVADKDPQVLADAEATFEKVGGTVRGIHLTDAAAINRIPRLRDNPELAMEVYDKAKSIKSGLTSNISSFKAEEFLRMGLIAHDFEQRGTPLKPHQVEEEYRRSVVAEKRAEEARSLQASQEAAGENKTAVEKPTGDAVRDSGSSPPSGQPADASADAYKNFREKLAALDSLPPGQMRDEYLKTAMHDTARHLANRGHRAAFASTPTAVVESETLKPGESKLTVTHNGKPIEVKTVESGEALQVVTADGTKVPLDQCKFEMQCGKGSSKEQIAREALVRSNELKDLFDGKPADPAHRMAADRAVQNTFDHGGAPERASHGVAERVAKLGAFELQSGREPVLLSSSGVKFGGKPEVTFETLVKETLKDKREHLERLEKSKGTGGNPELDGQIKILNEQIADLDHLSKNVHRPETINKLMETIKRHATTEEIERIRAEYTAGGGKFKEGVAKAGTYSLVAAFVAQMIFRESSQQDASIQYAPTSSRGL